MITFTPRSRKAATIRVTGNSFAVMDEIWSTIARRVVSVTPATIAANISSSSASSGTGTTSTVAPARRAAYFAFSSTAP